jgi:hypothetical protein
MAEIIEHLERHNPELLDMAAKWDADLENPAKAMLGFGMFYLNPKAASRDKMFADIALGLRRSLLSA